METTTNTKTARMALIGVFGAISGLLMLLEFQIPFALPYLKFDFSELPIILGAYLLGPMAGFFIIVTKILMNFVLNGSITFGVGELANMVGSVCYMLPAVLIYQRQKTKKGAEISLLVGVLTVSIAMVFVNWYITFPAYGKLAGFNLEKIISDGAAVNPLVKDGLTLMLCSVLPFNLLKYGVVSVITFCVYKKVKKLLRL